MNEVAGALTPPRPNSANSPPPKCAICLGTCTNKCFSDSCMHQFCFTCLLEWSKVKAECPLCKQSFKSIIHNIKSIDEYDEHVVQPPERPTIRGEELDAGFLYLPRTPSRHFQFRTTFTVDTDGEFAIQQMLLSHPLTNNLFNAPRDDYVLPRYEGRANNIRFHRAASSATSFRRWVYMSNLWVYAAPDLTGRYRDVTPQFYRANPATRNRLVPWLNRELNALLRENTQQVMHLVDVIMDHLTRWHIRGRSFKNLLSSYLNNKTNQFIHEFYNFMRSPYDMIGYDRHIIYTERPYSPTSSISDFDDDDDDSDVAIVNTSEPVGADNHPFRRPTFEVIEINSDTSNDSDVVIRETPIPEVVLVDSDSTAEEVEATTPEIQNTNNSISNNNSNNDNHVTDSSSREEESDGNRKPMLPLKIRLKHKRQSRERRSYTKRRCSKRHYSFSSRSSSASSDRTIGSSTSSNSSYRRYTERWHRHKRLKRSHKLHKEKLKVRSEISPLMIPFDNNNSNDSNVSRKPDYDTDDCIPLSKLKNTEKKKKSKRCRHIPTLPSRARTHTITSKNICVSSDEEVTLANANNDFDLSSKPTCSKWESSDVITEVEIAASPGTVSPVNLSLSTNALSNVNTRENPFRDAAICFKYEQCNPQNNTLPQFENIPSYDTFQSFRQYNTNEYNRYNSVTIGNRYYDGPDYNLSINLENYTPPLAHNNAPADSTTNTYNNCLYRNNLYRQERVETPCRANINARTSPIKRETEEQQSYNYYSTDVGPSSSRRMQSVIVKKENKESSQLYCGFLLNPSNSSDSDN